MLWTSGWLFSHWTNGLNGGWSPPLPLNAIVTPNVDKIKENNYCWKNGHLKQTLLKLEMKYLLTLLLEMKPIKKIRLFFDL